MFSIPFHDRKQPLHGRRRILLILREIDAELVNILGADTRNVNGKAFGSMLLGLPEDHGEAVRAMNYLKAQKDVTVEEVPDYHG